MLILSVTVVVLPALVEVNEEILVAPFAPEPAPVLLVLLAQLKLNGPPLVPAAAEGVMAACVVPLQLVVDVVVGAVALNAIVGTTVTVAAVPEPAQPTVL